jgi:hypothetical protein
MLRSPGSAAMKEGERITGTYEKAAGAPEPVGRI